MPNLKFFGNTGKSRSKAIYHKLDNVSDDEDEFSLSDEEKVLFRKPGEIELNLCPETRIHKANQPQTRWCRYGVLFCVSVVLVGSLVTVGVFYAKTHLTNQNNSTQLKPPASEVIVDSRNKEGWQVEFARRSTEGGHRLFDCDEDGLDDIIFAAGDISMMEVSKNDTPAFADMSRDCEKKGMTYPCMGHIYCLNGLDGHLLWDMMARSEVFLINCEDFDFDNDGNTDCIGTGRRATIVAFDPRKGKEIWRSENDTFYNGLWSTFKAAALPDWDGDGTPEVLIANGGDVDKAPEDHNRAPGRLVALSGRTGEIFGKQYLNMPNSRETYMSPVLYTPIPGATTYILFGNGGETVNGDLMGISLMDFCHFVLNDTKSQLCPEAVVDDEDSFSKIEKDENGTFVIYRGKVKGIMVPPVIVDVNNDGVPDILVHVFEGKIVLIDGKTGTQVWETNYNGMESYSTPAPGYFNEDDVLDFMVHWNTGEWMQYTNSNVSIINGKDGSILWSLDSASMQMSSPLTLATSEPNLHKFIFRQQGRDSVYRWDENGTLIRLNPTPDRQKRHGDEPGVNADLHTMEKFHMTEAEYRKMELEKRNPTCKDEMSSYRGEVLILDRHHVRSAVKILDLETHKQQYNARPHCPPKYDYDVDELGALDVVTAQHQGQREHLPMHQTDHDSSEIEDNPDGEGNVLDTESNNITNTPVVNNSKMKESQANTNGNTGNWRNGPENHQQPIRSKHTSGRKGVNKQVKMCALDKPDEMSTGLISDLDGDGNLDYVGIFSVHYNMYDAEYCRQGMAMRIMIHKVSMESSLIDGIFPTVTLKAKTSMEDKDYPVPVSQGTEKPKMFLPMVQQIWTQYMGKNGHSEYSKIR